MPLLMIMIIMNAYAFTAEYKRVCLLVSKCTMWTWCLTKYFNLLVCVYYQLTALFFSLLLSWNLPLIQRNQLFPSLTFGQGHFLARIFFSMFLFFFVLILSFYLVSSALWSFLPHLSECKVKIQKPNQFNARANSN